MQEALRLEKNTFAMSFLKGDSVAINLLLVPLTINYVNVDTDGIWLTIGSIVVWLIIEFDFEVHDFNDNIFKKALF